MTKAFAERADEHFDLRAVLEHARGLFCYHAQQRLSSIRYFFIAWGIIAVAYSQVFAARASGATNVDIILSLLSLAGILLTSSFWALDQRNAQLTHINERALKEIEEQLSKEYGLQFYDMALRAGIEKAIFQYKFIVHILFFSIFTLSFIAFANSSNIIVIIIMAILSIMFLYAICYNNVCTRHRVEIYADWSKPQDNSSNSNAERSCDKAQKLSRVDRPCGFFELRSVFALLLKEPYGSGKRNL